MSGASIEQYRLRLRELLSLLDDARAKLASRSEPIAIVGMAARFPGGGANPDAFFRALEQGVDAVQKIPDERWPSELLPADKPATRWAALLPCVDRFDADFFEISPREAASLDPQQRVLLEVAWEALEDAGASSNDADSRRTGVFVGMCHVDYKGLVEQQSLDQIDAYSGTGNIPATAAGRISYTFGFQGPCVSLDTACSSSLVAVHFACKSLRDGESDRVLAGGVSLLLSPVTMAIAAETQALSPDGRCKTFDAGANGFVRGEGCGVVVLKRLSDALRDGDRIHALIRGSVINQDGRSNGLTVPNVLSQESLLREALASARVSAADVGYVEMHGTGTSLGDPIEYEALRAVLGGPREDGSRCLLGALKTNIGHLEAAAGVASLIKTVLCLEHEVIPPNLHLKTLNPRISLEGTPFSLPTRATPWKAGDKPRIAGVSSFGISGTNAHVIVEEAPRTDVATQPSEDASSYVLPLSAKSAEALRSLARAYSELLAAQPPSGATRLHDIAYTASVRRSHHEHRLAVVGTSKQELASALDAFARGESAMGVASGKANPIQRATVVFVFSGHGPEWPIGLGRELLADEPVFREAIERCDALLRRHGSLSLSEEMTAPPERTRVAQPEVAQPVLFAVQVALVELVRSWGVSPGAVVGHGLGEVAAAWAAGALSLEDAIAIVHHRARLMQAPRLHGEEERHGPEHLEDELTRSLARAGLAPRAAEVPIFSSVAGALIASADLTPEHWAKSLRARADLAGALDAAISCGHRVFLEVGPHPVLVADIEERLEHCAVSGCALGSLRRDRNARRALLDSLATLYVHGHAVTWSRLYGAPGRCVSLPSYPWQRERYWIKTSRKAPPARAALARNAGTARRQGPVFVFAGQGSQWLGMGRALRRTAPVFREALERCERALARFVDWSLSAELEADEGRSSLHRIEVCQPALFAIEVALTALWRSFGVEPAAVVGHSRGEITAAHVAGVLSLEDAAQIMCRRSQVLRRLSGMGAMAVVGLSSDDTHRALAPYAGRLSIAIVQSPGFTVVSGEPGALDELTTALRSRNVFCRRVKHDVAMHSPQLDALRTDLLQATTGIRPEMGSVPIWSTVTGELQPGHAFDAAYWYTNAREPVLFAETIRRVLDTGHDTFIEVSPHPILTTAIEQIAQHAGRKITALPSLQRDADEERSMRASLAALHAAGHAGDGNHSAPEHQVGATPNAPSAATRPEQPGQTTANLVDGWLHELTWRPSPRGASASRDGRSAPGRWLLLADRGGVGDSLGGLLEAQGESCTVIRPNGAGELPTGEELARRVHDLATEEGPPWRGVVHLWSLDATSPHHDMSGGSGARLLEDQQLGCGSVIRLVQSLAEAGGLGMPRLWLVTRGAHRVRPGEPVAIAQAPLWGLGRVLAEEQPETWGGLVDLDPRAPGDEAVHLVRELRDPDGEDHVALRGGERHVLRLVPHAARSDGAATPVRIHSDATYLIAGGLGGLGLEAARWMARRGARHLVLIGRRGASEEARKVVREIEQAGANIRVLRADIADRQELARALADVTATFPVVRGVIHSAAVVDESVGLRLTWAKLANAFAPKIAGAYHLHELTRELPLDFFVLFSSALSLFGVLGHGAYAASNVALDALAHYRRAEGLPALSINWPGWAQVGLGARVSQAALEQLGLRALSAEEGVVALEQLIERSASQASAAAQIAVLPFVETLPKGRGSSLCAEIAREAQPSAQKPELVLRIEQALPAERERVLLSYVRREVALVLGYERDDTLDVQRGFFQMGMDSLRALELKNRLQVSLGRALPSTLSFDYPTITRLAEYIGREVLPRTTRDARPAEPPRGEADDSIRMKRLLGRIKDVSEDELRRLLMSS